MNHLKNIVLIVLITAGFIGCTEIYTPEISADTEALIVEALITDGAGPFKIKLSKVKSNPFGAVGFTTSIIKGAKVVITDNENNTFTTTDGGYGNYNLPPDFKAKTGNSYKMNIKTRDGNIYESTPQKLLPPQTYDTIRALYATKSYLGTDNKLVNSDGADIRVDLFGSLTNKDSLPLCRFNSKITIQYSYNQYMIDPITGELMIDEITKKPFDWFLVCFGYRTLSMNDIENITEEKSVTSKAFIKNHSIGFAPYGSRYFGIGLPSQAYVFYYIRIDQYTMNSDTYRFYKAANKQLSATGKIFDPITSQLYGNMKCVNDPSKIVLGLFEVSSVTQSAIVIHRASADKKIALRKVTYVDITPDSMLKQYKVWIPYPDGIRPTTDDYIPIPFPDWWYHE